jgi:hypothetical protein
MLRLEPRQRAALSETIRELANLVAAALVVGQVITARPQAWLIAGGIAIWAIWLAFVGLALLLEEERQWKARS